MPLHCNQRLTRTYWDPPLLSADTSITPSQLPLIGCADVFTWIPCGPRIHQSKMCVTAARFRLWEEGRSGSTRRRQFRPLAVVPTRQKKIEQKLGRGKPCLRTAAELLRYTEGDAGRWWSGTVPGKAGRHTTLAYWLRLNLKRGNI